MRLALRRLAVAFAKSVALVCVGVVLAIGAGLVWERSRQSELDAMLEQLDTYVPPTSVEVFDHRGERFDTFAVERRTWVPLAEMSEWVPTAVTSSEDRRFFSHGGVDPLGIARAAWVNLRRGSIQEGGSTLTQQLVKNLLVGDRRSFGRKIDEALLARRLEARRSKEEILELYLNYAYFGSGNYGVEAASQDYFGVSVREVDTSQAAMLAALIPAPSRYSPRRDLDAARAQRRRVLLDLSEVGRMPRSEALALAERDFEPPARKKTPIIGVGNAYRTAVRRVVRDHFAGDSAFRLGLKIDTPYDPELQAIAEQAVQDAAEAVESRQGLLQPVGRLVSRAEYKAFAQPSSDEQVSKAPEPGDCVVAMIQRPWGPVRAGPHEIELVREEWMQKVRSLDVDRPARVLASEGRWGQLFETCIDSDGRGVLSATPWVEGAAVVIENSRAEVIALVGGRAMPLEGFDLATQGRRQPGSTFKPYVYGTALASGATQLDLVLDGPISVGGWSPRNAGGGYTGEVPMRVALARSLNTVAVRLANREGVPAVREFAKACGVDTPLREDLTLALGSSEVTVLDQAVGFSTFARGGMQTEPVFLRTLRDLHGEPVAIAGEPVTVDGSTVRLPGPDGSRAIPEAVAFQLVDMLTEGVRSGTGRRAYDPDRDRAGKTGTTSNNVDAWFSSA